jgi:hypothetical protein
MLTAVRMVNYKDLRYHLRASRFDAVIVVVTAVAAFAISIEFCVLIGMVMSFLLAVPPGYFDRVHRGRRGHARERLFDDRLTRRSRSSAGRAFGSSVASKAPLTASRSATGAADRRPAHGNGAAPRRRRHRRARRGSTACSRAASVLLCGVRPEMKRARAQRASRPSSRTTTSSS